MFSSHCPIEKYGSEPGQALRQDHVLRHELYCHLHSNVYYHGPTCHRLAEETVWGTGRNSEVHQCLPAGKQRHRLKGT